MLRGGAGNCVNNHTEAGIPIDPIGLETIPLNKIIRVPVSWEEDEYIRLVPTATTDYYCFNQTTLLQWLKGSTKNPMTGIRFTRQQGSSIVDQIKGPVYTWNNGFRSPFSHPIRIFGPVAEDAAGPNPWPRGLLRILYPELFPGD
jgi:hypothetical protein